MIRGFQMGNLEIDHVIVRKQKGDRWHTGYYVCLCGQRFDTFHKWRSHRSHERRMRLLGTNV